VSLKKRSPWCLLKNKIQVNKVGKVKSQVGIELMRQLKCIKTIELTQEEHRDKISNEYPGDIYSKGKLSREPVNKNVTSDLQLQNGKCHKLRTKRSFKESKEIIAEIEATDKTKLHQDDSEIDVSHGTLQEKREAVSHDGCFADRNTEIVNLHDQKDFTKEITDSQDILPQIESLSAGGTSEKMPIGDCFTDRSWVSILSHEAEESKIEIIEFQEELPALTGESVKREDNEDKKKKINTTNAMQESALDVNPKPRERKQLFGPNEFTLNSYSGISTTKENINKKDRITEIKNINNDTNSENNISQEKTQSGEEEDKLKCKEEKESADDSTAAQCELGKKTKANTDRIKKKERNFLLERIVSNSYESEKDCNLTSALNEENEEKTTVIERVFIKEENDKLQCINTIEHENDREEIKKCNLSRNQTKNAFKLSAKCLGKRPKETMKPTENEFVQSHITSVDEVPKNEIKSDITKDMQLPEQNIANGEPKRKACSTELDPLRENKNFYKTNEKLKVQKIYEDTSKIHKECSIITQTKTKELEKNEDNCKDNETKADEMENVKKEHTSCSFYILSGSDEFCSTLVKSLSRDMKYECIDLRPRAPEKEIMKDLRRESVDIKESIFRGGYSLSSTSEAYDLEDILQFSSLKISCFVCDRYEDNTGREDASRQMRSQEKELSDMLSALLKNEDPIRRSRIATTAERRESSSSHDSLTEFQSGKCDELIHSMCNTLNNHPIIKHSFNTNQTYLRDFKLRLNPYQVKEKATTSEASAKLEQKETQASKDTKSPPDLYPSNYDEFLTQFLEAITANYLNEFTKEQGSQKNNIRGNRH
ncbi:hypothetical protein SK128_027620, partial [Halocaridina rubra]